MENNTAIDNMLKQFLHRDMNGHHTVTFDFLLHHSIVNIVKTYGKFITLLNGTRYKFIIQDTFVETISPPPSVCYAHGLNYTLSVKATVLFYQENELYTNIWELQQEQIIDIAHLPLMTGDTNILSNCSKEEKEEIKRGEPFSGIFICRGKSRTIPMIKGIKNNIPIYRIKDKYIHCQVRSVHSDKMYRSTSTIDVIMNMQTLRFGCKVPFQPTSIPIGIIVRALDCDQSTFVEMVYAYINNRIDDMEFYTYKISLLHTDSNIESQKDAIMFISKLYGKTIVSTGENVIFNECFPHLRDLSETSNMCPKSNSFKTIFLAHCVATMILIHTKQQTCTIRDRYTHAHITTVSDQIGSLFRLLFIAHMRTCGKLLRRALMKVLSSHNSDSNVQKKIDVVKVYGEPRLSARIMSAVSSGIWSKLRKGVSMSLNSNNDDAIEAQLRRVSSTLASTDGTHTDPRNIQPDQYGFICAASTPDGESTGLVYELALTCSVSPPVSSVDVTTICTIVDSIFETDTSILPMLEWFKTYKNKHVSTDTKDWYQFIGPNHIPSYMVFNVEKCVNTLRCARRQGHISCYAFISVQHDRRIIRLEYTGGQLFRPLIIADAVHSISETQQYTSWKTYVDKGIVEYVSPAEQSSICCISTNINKRDKEITHLELTEASFLGIMGATVPFATGQQGPRLAYFTAQKRQIITSKQKQFRGTPSTCRLLHTFQPLVQSKTTKMLPIKNSVGKGTPVVLAFMSLPDNQEDAIVIKREALDRGAFKAISTRTYLSEATSSGNMYNESFENPGKIVGNHRSDYRFLTDTGLPSIRTKVPGNVVIIGKTKTIRQLPQQRGHHSTVNKCDISTVSKHDENGTITHAEKYKLHNGTRVHVDITTTRPVCVGDKFTSTYAQKGVVGAIWNSENMPFSMQTGMIPDIIASPLSLTSRMTMSSLIEALTGKVVCITGKRSLGIDHQEFSNGNCDHVQKMENMLKQNGFCHDGTEMFIDGRTGKLLQTRIFVGCIEMYRLVHMATKKIHARSIGPRDPLTRQPKDGRKFGGGLRIGEMESSALAAHGCSRVLQERFREHSDSFDVFICSSCGCIADDVNENIQHKFCHICQDGQYIQSVKMPFTFLILVLELLSTGITVRFKVATV
jgi:DNA-directed RNA polymerase II subunit RPB2